MSDRIVLYGRALSEGIVQGEALVSRQPFGFWQGIDPESGMIIDRRCDLFGECIEGRVFIFPYGRGSTGTPGIFLEAVRNGKGPTAIINRNSEPMIMVCAILAKEFMNKEIPIIDNLNQDPIEVIKTGFRVRVNGYNGKVEVFV